MKETLYQKIVKYLELLESHNVLLLDHMFEYFEDFQNERKVKSNEVRAKDLAVYTALRDYECKKNLAF